MGYHQISKRTQIYSWSEVNLTWLVFGLRHGDGRSAEKDREEDREDDLQQESVKPPLVVM